MISLVSGLIYNYNSTLPLPPVDYFPSISDEGIIVQAMGVFVMETGFFFFFIHFLNK